MNTKLIIIASVWTCLQFVIACCPDSTYDYVHIDTYEVSNGKWKDMQLADSASVSAEDFRIIIDIQSSLITKSSIGRAFVNSCYATSCRNEGLEGLKVKIERVQITSDQSFGGIAAGEPLNFLFNAHAALYNDESKNERISIVEMMMEVNEDYNLSSTYYLELKDKNISSDFISFNIALIFEDGTTMTSNTNTIKIE